MNNVFLSEYLFESAPSLELDNTGREKRSWIKDPIVILVIRLILASVFIYAATQKIGKPLLFADEIRMYGILTGGPLLYIISIVLPWMEIFCGLSLISGIFMRGAALILAVFNLAFIFVISFRSVLIIRNEGTPFMSIFFDCGCGFGATYAWKKLIEDALLLAGAVLIFAAPPYRFVFYPRRKRREL
ncbi:MAG: DoxX family protein [Candidatus Krumholzibacteriota bacterium]|nr:DoxX family protein [Candidatus Krumholzibacteriota bacterium]